MKRYRVTKVYDNMEVDCGLLPESDVKAMTKGYTFDELLNFYRRKNGKYIIVIKEEK